MRALLAISTFALATLCAPLHAGAQAYRSAASDGGSEEELTRKYEQAQEHYLAKRYTEALPLFEQVAVGLDSPNAMLYVARCLREMGRLVEAYRAMRRTVDRATERAKSETRFVKTREEAVKELHGIEGLIGRVSISMTAPPAGTVIEINGARLEQISQTVAVMPGKVHIAATAPGRDPIRQEIDIAAGTLQTVALRFAEPATAIEPTPPPSPYVPPSTPQQPPSQDPAGDSSWTNDGTIRILGIVVAGVGLAGWTTFTVAGIMAEDNFSKIKAECGTERCVDPTLNDTIDEGRTQDTVANVGLTVGAVGTVAGTLMIIFGGADDSGPATVGGGFSSQGGWLSYFGRF